MDDRGHGIVPRESALAAIFVHRSRVPMRDRWIAWAVGLVLGAVATALWHGWTLLGALAVAGSGPVLLDVAWLILSRRGRLPATWVPGEDEI